MKKISFILFLFIGTSSFAQGGFKFKKKIFGYTIDQILVMTNAADSSLYIDDLITKLFTPDSTLTDFEIAMGYYGYVMQPDYNPDKYIGLELQVMRLNDDKDWKMAKKAADSLITQYPTCLMGHVELAHAYNSLQDTGKAATHRLIYERLGDVIYQTGDGKSMETAYIITGLKDIEVLTQLQRMQIIKRKTKRKKDNYYEIVTVFKNFKEFDVYFDTSLIEEFRR